MYNPILQIHCDLQEFNTITMKNALIIALVTIVFSGCQEKRKDIDFPELFKVQEEITLTPLQDSSNLFLGKPWSILVLNDHIIVQDLIDGYWFALVDKHTGKLIKRFGVSGRGPGEISHPASLQRNGRDFTFLDQQLLKLYTASIDSLITGQPGYIKECIDLKLPKQTFTDCRQILKLSSGELIGAGVSPEGRIVRFDADGKNARFYSPDYPYDPLHKDEDYKAKSMAFQYHIAINPAENKFCNLGGTAGQLEIFDLTPDGVKPAVNHIYYLPKYTNYSNKNMMQVGFAPDSKIGFSNLEAVGDYIWFSNTKDESLKNRTPLVGYIGKFDWNGNPVKAYRVTNNLLMYSFDPDGKEIYGIALNPETMEPELVMAAIN